MLQLHPLKLQFLLHFLQNGWLGFRRTKGVENVFQMTVCEDFPKTKTFEVYRHLIIMVEGQGGRAERLCTDRAAWTSSTNPEKKLIVMKQQRRKDEETKNSTELSVYHRNTAAVAEAPGPPVWIFQSKTKQIKQER